MTAYKKVLQFRHGQKMWLIPNSELGNNLQPNQRHVHPPPPPATALAAQ